jgi:hypothetical protein
VTEGVAAVGDVGLSDTSFFSSLVAELVGVHATTAATSHARIANTGKTVVT